MKRKLLVLGLLIFFVFGVVYIHAQTANEDDYKNNPETYLSKSPPDPGFIQWFSTAKEEIMGATWEKIINPDLRKKLINSIDTKSQVKLYNSVGSADSVIQSINPEKRNSFLSSLIKTNSASANKDIKVKGFENAKSIKTDHGGKIVIVTDSKGNELQISVSTVPENFDLISLIDKAIQYDDHKNSNVLVLSKGYIQKDIYVDGTPTGKIELLEYTGKGMDNPVIDFNSGKGQSFMIGVPGEGFKNGINMWGDKIKVDIGDFTFKPNPEGPKTDDGTIWGFVSPIKQGVFNLEGDVSAPGLGLVIFDTQKGIFDATGKFLPDPAYNDIVFRYQLNPDKTIRLGFSGKNLEGHANFVLEEGLSFTYQNIDGTPAVSAFGHGIAKEGYPFYIIEGKSEGSEVDVPRHGTISQEIELPITATEQTATEQTTHSVVAQNSPDTENRVSADVQEVIPEAEDKALEEDGGAIPLPDEHTLISRTSDGSVAVDTKTIQKQYGVWESSNIDGYQASSRPGYFTSDVGAGLIEYVSLEKLTEVSSGKSVTVHVTEPSWCGSCVQEINSISQESRKNNLYLTMSQANSIGGSVSGIPATITVYNGRAR